MTAVVIHLTIIIHRDVSFAVILFTSQRYRGGAYSDGDKLTGDDDYSRRISPERRRRNNNDWARAEWMVVVVVVGGDTVQLYGMKRDILAGPTTTMLLRSERVIKSPAGGPCVIR